MKLVVTLLVYHNNILRYRLACIQNLHEYLIF